MGSWNKTCGLSRLHIKEGEPVYIFVLEQSDDGDSLCYGTALYSPTLLPFYGEYNDYGGGQNCHGVALNYIMDGLKKLLIEKEVGENKCHDIAVKREGFDVEQFFEVTHERRLAVKNWKNNPSEVNFVMFRADIVEEILENRVIKQYVGNGKGNSGEDNCYVVYNFSDLMLEVDSFMEALYTQIEESTNEWGFVPSYHMERIIENMRDSYKLAQYIVRDSYRYGTIVKPYFLITELINEGKLQTAKEILVEFVKAVFIDRFMDDVRVLWIPGCFDGSQNEDHAGYRLLTTAINKVLDKEQQQWDEDYED